MVAAVMGVGEVDMVVILAILGLAVAMIVVAVALAAVCLVVVVVLVVTATVEMPAVRCDGGNASGGCDASGGDSNDGGSGVTQLVSRDRTKCVRDSRREIERETNYVQRRLCHSSEVRNANSTTGSLRSAVSLCGSSIRPEQMLLGKKVRPCTFGKIKVNGSLKPREERCGVSQCRGQTEVPNS